MTIPVTQTGLVQSSRTNGESPILVVSHEVAVPNLLDAAQVLIRVLAVALNPTDFKMLTYFPEPATDNPKPIGCDFCGIVENSGSEETAARFPRGTRVCGGIFPYGQVGVEQPLGGAFAQWVATDADQLLRVPGEWDDLEGAALGGIGWATCVLGLFIDPDALFLPGRPSNTAEKGLPVLVYGGATATGTMACQLLKLSGHVPIAVNSSDSANMVQDYGAAATVPYTSPTCAEEIKSCTPGGLPLRHALDCITSPESVSTCFASIGRAGGRYACLEGCKPEWRTRRAVRVKEVMGFEGSGRRVTMFAAGSEDATYSRDANPEFRHGCIKWAAELQSLLDRRMLKSHPQQEIASGWDGIVQGLDALSRGEVRGKKLVVRIPQARTVG